LEPSYPVLVGVKARQRLIPRCPLTSYPAASSSIVTPDARCPLAGLLVSQCAGLRRLGRGRERRGLCVSSFAGLPSRQLVIDHGMGPSVVIQTRFASSLEDATYKPVSASHISRPQLDIHLLATAACHQAQRSSHGSRGRTQSRSLPSRTGPPHMTRLRRHLLWSSV
jgi:hypothetical protein